MNAVQIHAAAQELGVSVATLRRWMREGCPVASRGRRGRGLATMIDPDAVRTWRQAGSREAVLLALASSLPDVLAGGIEKAHQLAEGTDKRRLAGILAGAWFLATAAILETLHEHCPAIAPDPRAVPEKIERLRKIAAG
jgi:hypothetical protein